MRSSIILTLQVYRTNECDKIEVPNIEVPNYVSCIMGTQSSVG